MLLAVIIPFYNAQKYIGAAIDSCLIQKEIDQIIMVDDGSKDSSLDIVREKAQTDSRIEVLLHSQNLGRSAARNTGMAAIRSTYFSFLDADDFYLKDRFVSTIKVLKSQKDIDGVYEAVKSRLECDQHSDTPEVTMISEGVQSHHLFEFLVLGNGHFSIIGSTFRSSPIADTYRFDESLKMGEDTDWIWRVVHGHNLSRHDGEPMVVRRVHGANTYFNKKQSTYWKFEFYKKWNKNKDQYTMTDAMKSKIRKSYFFYARMLVVDRLREFFMGAE